MTVTKGKSILVGALVLAVLGGALAWLLLRPLEKPPDRLVLSPAAFASLEGWAGDDHGAALAAFVKSCGVFSRLPPTRSLGAGGVAGTVGDWLPVCEAAVATQRAGGGTRRFFEQWFQPFEAANNGGTQGLFTGYYEAELNGARKPGGPYVVPLYARPDDLVMVDLGRFRADLKGRRIAGRVVDGSLRPFESRAEIEQGALANRGLELLWVDDAVDAFFLHVQGSGRVRLADGSVVRLGYAGQNGRPYFAIGRDLIERGALTADNVSLQSIRAWLEANPEEAPKVMARNASFVFFRILEGEGPLGSQSVALTPQRSLAVDRTFVPLGVPLWLDTSKPVAAKGGGPDRAPFRHLMVAQDSGGAIRGPVRGDVFWGFGRAAEATAGPMKEEGRYWLLLPKTLNSVAPSS